MKKFQLRSLVAAAAVAGLLATGIPSAQAAPAAVAQQQNVVSLAEINPSQGSIADQVKAAGSLDEAIGILESNGFQKLPATGAEGREILFEKTVDGFTVGFSLPASSGIQARWGGGWNWGKGGPYVKATLGQWKDATNVTGIVGISACTLITATLGAAGCAAVIGIALYFANKTDVSKWPKNSCVAVSATKKVWLERC